MFTIFHRFMKIGNKGVYNKNVCDDKNKNFQLMWIQLDVVGICRVLIKWIETCIKHKKLDTLIQITSRISRVLQFENHKKFYRN